MPQSALIQQSMKTWPNMMQTSLFFSLYTNINLAFVLNLCILLYKLRIYYVCKKANILLWSKFYN